MAYLVKANGKLLLTGQDEHNRIVIWYVGGFGYTRGLVMALAAESFNKLLLNTLSSPVKLI